MSSTCDGATGLQDFSKFVIVLVKILEATMAVTPYDDHKVSLWRPHGKGDLDIIWASLNHQKANVTKA